MKVGILYICLGEYIKFFEEFYNTCEKYFLPEVEKEYFIFTDKKEIKNISNVNIIFTKNEGWPENTLKRFEYFLNIKNYLDKIDYLYFFNANYIFKDEILEKEIIPSEKENYLVALCWDKVNNKDKEEYTYERNKKSSAFIPYGKGEKYYQGGFFGGKKEEFIELVEECQNLIEKDKKINYIAIYHDESYLNKYFYLLDKKIKIVNEKYGMPEEWDNNQKNRKCILRDKNKILGEKYIKILKNNKEKDRFKNLKEYLIEVIKWIKK